MHDQTDNGIKIITKDDLIKKFTAASLIYDQKTSAFSYNFPLDRVFETPEETIEAMESQLEYKGNTWHTICPLYVPQELKDETDLSQCLHFDSVMKDSMFQSEHPEKEHGAEIISIEEVYHENDAIFPGENS